MKLIALVGRARPKAAPAAAGYQRGSFPAPALRLGALRGAQSRSLGRIAAPALRLGALLLALNVYGQEPSREELERLNEAIASVRESIQRTESEHAAAETALREAEQAVAELKGRIRENEAAIEAASARLAGLRRREEELLAQRDQQRALVADYIRGAWRGGRQEYIKLLLNQEDAARTARALAYYRYFSEARARRISAFNATLEELDSVREEILRGVRTLEQSRRDLAARQAELEQSQQRREASLAALDAALKESGSELARLERERREMQLLIEELERSIADMSLGGQQQPFAERKGKLPWPVEGPLLNAYGARHQLGDLNWQGVTIAARAGEDVRAIHHGRVVYADWFSSSGLLLILDHGGGYMSLYARNQQLYKEVGDWVAAGEAIAAAGNTGGQRETGVYFEIRHDGRSQDPVVWCVDRR